MNQPPTPEDFVVALDRAIVSHSLIDEPNDHQTRTDIATLQLIRDMFAKGPTVYIHRLPEGYYSLKARTPEQMANLDSLPDDVSLYALPTAPAKSEG